MQFVIYRDYKVGKGAPWGYDYTHIEVESFEEAIDKAECMNDEDVYLISIMKKIGRTEKEGTDWRCETYEAVLTKRSTAWHVHKGNEYEHKAHRKYIIGKMAKELNGNLEYIEAV